MSWTDLAAATAMMLMSTEGAPSPPSDPLGLRAVPPPAATAPELPVSAEITVLTYNVKGLPWPIAFGRAAALKAIGRELAQMRKEGRQPDVVLIQEGFRGEIADLVQASGYKHWAQGPTRSERSTAPAPEGARGWRGARYRLRGEGWGKLTGSGLHVLSDLPIGEVRSTVYRYCAGLDCLANKGAMAARITLPGGVAEIDVVNTHLNSKRKAQVPMKRTLKAHNLQTDEFMAFVAEQQAGGRPVLIGGDFNVKGAPDRYAYRADGRPYKVVSEFCGDRAAGCQGHAPPAQDEPWLQSQDLQAFMGGRSVDLRPVHVDVVFDGAENSRVLSDHAGYMVRYKVSWSRDAAGGEQAGLTAPSDRRAAAAPVGPIRANASLLQPAEPSAALAECGRGGVRVDLSGACLTKANDAIGAQASH